LSHVSKKGYSNHEYTYLRTKANSFHKKKCEPPNSKAYSCKNKFVQHMEDGYLKA